MLMNMPRTQAFPYVLCHYIFLGDDKHPATLTWQASLWAIGILVSTYLHLLFTKPTNACQRQITHWPLDETGNSCRSLFPQMMPSSENVAYWFQSHNSIFMTVHKMTSSNGNIFRITGPVCGELTGHRWIPRTKTSDAELWCFLWSAPE